MMKHFLVVVLVFAAALAQPSNDFRSERDPKHFMNGNVDALNKKYDVIFTDMVNYEGVQKNCTLAKFGHKNEKTGERKFPANNTATQALWASVHNKEWPYWVDKGIIKDEPLPDGDKCVSLFRNKLRYQMCGLRLPYICQI